MESSVDLLRWQFGVVHALLATWSVNASVSLTQYAESVVVEDVTVHGIAGRAPLALSTWRGRTGLSRLPPLSRFRGERTWTDNVAINVGELRTYAQAVYAATDSFLSGFAPAPDRLTFCVLTALLLSLSARYKVRQLVLLQRRGSG